MAIHAEYQRVTTLKSQIVTSNVQLSEMHHKNGRYEPRTKQLDLGRDLGYNIRMKKVSKGLLKAKMFEFFREVEATGEPLVVTDRGKEVLKLVRITNGAESIDKVFEPFRGKLKFYEDPNAPTTDEWNLEE